MFPEQDEFRSKTLEYIGLAEKKLTKLQEELQRLESIQRQISDLQTAIEKAKAAAGIIPEPPPFPEFHRQARKEKEEADGPRTIREKTKSLILEFGRPMRVDEIAQEFQKRGWKLSSTESIRIMCWKYKDTFKRVGERLYDVIK